MTLATSTRCVWAAGQGAVPAHYALTHSHTHTRATYTPTWQEIKFLDGKERVEQTGMGRQASRMAKALGSAKQ